MIRATLRLATALLLFGVVQAPGSAWAQAPSIAGGGGNFSVGGKAVPAPGGNSGAPAPGGGQTCVQVQIQGQKPNPYDCLNQKLQSQVQGTSPTSPSLPLGANSPSNKVGTFNEQGLREQYGQNFGKSVVPYRPPPPTFSNALHP